MENYLYTCQYCSKIYKPNRRKKQKYCSNSCRTRAFIIRKHRKLSISNALAKKTELPTVGKMSWAGVGNAAAGTLAVNVATNLLTRDENRAATKKDLQDMKDLLLNRYHPVLNMPINNYGLKPFYDMDTQQIVYLNSLSL